MTSSGGYNDETAGQLLQSKEDVEQVPFQLLNLTQYILGTFSDADAIVEPGPIFEWLHTINLRHFG